MLNQTLCCKCGACVNVCHANVHQIATNDHSLAQENCDACGKCVEACPQRALRLCGKIMSIAEIMDTVLEDKTFYDVSGGGVTLGGGEPLAQWQSARGLLQACRAAGVSTAMETCGMAKWENLEQVAPLVDLFLYDIKHMDASRHKELTGCGNDLILDNLQKLLRGGYKVRCRMPLMEGLNADTEEMNARRDFLLPFAKNENFSGVDLLPYHRLGVHKYAQLGMAYDLPGQKTISDEILNQYRQIFAQAGISANIVKH